MRLEDWSTYTFKDNEGIERTKLKGVVYGSHDFKDGTNITTSYIIGKHNGRIVTVGKSLYELGFHEDNHPFKKEWLFATLEEVSAPPVNRIKCLICNTVLESHYRHDFQECDCENGAYVDGGLDYQRVGGSDMSMIKIWDNEINDWKPTYSEAPLVASQIGLMNKRSETDSGVTIVYKLLHIPTGLYFKPGVNNLSKQGKIYKSKPNIKEFTKYTNKSISDWKIVKFSLEEIDEKEN